jgi:hypothetical protein
VLSVPSQCSLRNGAALVHFVASVRNFFTLSFRRRLVLTFSGVVERLRVAFEKQLGDFDVQITLEGFVDADAVAYRLSMRRKS